MSNRGERFPLWLLFRGSVLLVAISVCCGKATAYQASGQGNSAYQDDSATDPDRQNSEEEILILEGSRQGARTTSRPDESTQSERTGERPQSERTGERPQSERTAGRVQAKRTGEKIAPERKKEKTRPGPPRPEEDQNRPETVGKETPYSDLPALQDLYRQIPSQRAALKRFGADIFLNGTGNLESLPMDLPAGPDYVLGSGDGLNLNLWGSASQRLTRIVDREGRVALPDAGNAAVAGQTVSQAQETIQKALTAQFRDVKVDVSLTRLRSVRVYVVGDVERPGAYDISSLSTSLNALYAAGGPTARSSLRTVRQYRGKQLVREVDLYELLLQGVRPDAERLEPGDTILVPPLAMTMWCSASSPISARTNGMWIWFEPRR